MAGQGTPEPFDVVVIGGGKGGKTLAIDLAKQGYKAALIERDPDRIGGTCINVACIPTKTLVQSAKIADWVRRAREYGIEAEITGIAMPSIRERKRQVVAFMRGGNYKQFTSTAGLEFMLGQARFVGHKVVEVRLREGGARILLGKHVVINTGTRPKVPALQGLRDVSPLTSETILELDVLPEHLIIIGGGFEGVEFAQMFHRFGSRVTLIHRGAQLLPAEDPDVAEAVRQTFEREGIHVLLGTSAERAEAVAGGVRVYIQPAAAAVVEAVEGSHVLTVTGREPVTAELEVAATGLALNESGFLPVNEHLATVVPGIWAVGDVTGGPEFTHVSLDDYRILKAQISGIGDYTSTTGRILTYAVFTDPELGRVGLTEKEARRQGYRVRVARLAANTIAMPRAQTTGQTTGFLKAVVDAANDRILGTAFYVAEASEMNAVIHLAMRLGVPYTMLRDEMYTHPTFMEGLNGLFTSWVV
ncbi:MAG: PF00070 family, FAD-dependent NAD(P)-disulfide oxidoreductase [Ktedonobacterales bacterium]|jgi:pyruvate/2-oxoglutarate dehydrogenase complex dihydrolipoamide dehydrogenase (E3) component|nr:MAG: PF00070 family, FAD-dependent NAD(P)-disulfide oxidoreductase [Ktedonobacterales bacterium]